MFALYIVDVANAVMSFHADGNFMINEPCLYKLLDTLEAARAEQYHPLSSIFAECPERVSEEMSCTTLPIECLLLND